VWISFVTFTHGGGSFEQALNWHDGRTISPPVSRARFGDLDLAAGTRRVCRPIRRRARANGFPSAGATFSYRSPWALTVSRNVDLILQRCGHRPLTIARGPEWPYAQLGARFVTWSHRSRVHVRSLRTGHVKVWRVPRGRTGDAVPLLAGQHLLVRVPMKNGKDVVYRGRLP
jgi:hypothetical protein